MTMRIARRLVLLALGLCASLQAEPRWPKERALAWSSQQPWLVGCNFIPSTAINQLEMWQADTFDAPTIDRELGFAESVGMNVVRVFLHNLAWEQDAAGFKERMGRFLALAEQHHIKAMFVLFDSCWNDHPKSGKQPAPKPGVHNSGWLRAPIFAWDAPMPDKDEPPVWFHEVFRPDGTPFKASEVEFLKSITALPAR